MFVGVRACEFILIVEAFHWNKIVLFIHPCLRSWKSPYVACSMLNALRLLQCCVLFFLFFSFSFFFSSYIFFSIRFYSSLFWSFSLFSILFSSSVFLYFSGAFFPLLSTSTMIFLLQLIHCCATKKIYSPHISTKICLPRFDRMWMNHVANAWISIVDFRAETTLKSILHRFVFVDCRHTVCWFEQNMQRVFWTKSAWST